MKFMKIILFCSILFAFSFAAEMVIKAELLDMVDNAVTLVETKGDKALKEISKKDGRFVKGSLYVFAYNEKVEIIAHPIKPYLIGKSYKGKPDVKGKKFRDAIVAKALAGSGWSTYHYQKPNTKGLFLKKTYSRLAVHKGKKYIICAGMYAGK